MVTFTIHPVGSIFRKLTNQIKSSVSAMYISPLTCSYVHVTIAQRGVWFSLLILHLGTKYTTPDRLQYTNCIYKCAVHHALPLKGTIQMVYMSISFR